MQDYVVGLKKKILRLNERVKKAKVNLNTIKELIDQWIDTPLFTRKETEKSNLFNLEDMPKFKEDRYLQIANCAEEIQLLITEISECFLIHKKIKPTSRRWRTTT